MPPLQDGACARYMPEWHRAHCCIKDRHPQLAQQTAALLCSQECREGALLGLGLV